MDQKREPARGQLPLPARSRYGWAGLSRQVASLTATVSSLAGFAVLWQLMTMSGVVNARLFPSPVTVGHAAADMAARGVLLDDAIVSLRRVVVGFVLGGTIGVVLGLVTGRIHLAHRVLSPVLTVLRPIPAIALVPVAIVWFGIGDDSKYFVIAYAVGLTVWVNTHAGACGVPNAYLRAARSLGAKRLRIFVEIVVPAAAPFIITGLRLGATVAFLSLVAAELTGASGGIGYRLQSASQYLATDQMFVGLIELGVLGALLDQALAWLGRRLVHWEGR